MARPVGTKKIESPDKLWELFEQYRDEVKSNPRKKHVFVGKDGSSEFEMLERPLTYEGFQNFCEDNICCVHQYFENQNNSYTDYLNICSRIRRVIRQDQIEGGIVGQYNPSITQRLNGLTEKVESKNENNNIVSGELVVNIKSSNAKLANKESDIDTKRHT